MLLNGIASSRGDVMAGVGAQDKNSLLHTTLESWDKSRLNPFLKKKSVYELGYFPVIVNQAEWMIL